MKANDANTLAASVGCPVGANRVEWLVAEVERLRAENEQIKIDATDVIESFAEMSWGIGLPQLIVTFDGGLWPVGRDNAKAIVEALYQKVKVGRGWLSQSRSETAEAQRECESLRAQVTALTPRWQEGEPPCELWQVKAVWREGMSTPVRIKRFEEGLYWWFDESTCRRWDAPSPVRWAPIPKPTEG